LALPRAAILGCAGPDLSADERAFFRDADPLGFIVFARNVDSRDSDVQGRARRLVEELRSCVARADAPVLIDQEGGDVDCLPVLDIAFPETHAVIGDRAYGAQPGPVAALGRAAAEGLMAQGVMAVIKHIPGHGRASVDSHLSLPEVASSRAELERADFLPFRLLSDLPWAMTAHVLYKAIDPDAPLTVSARGVRDVIRRHIGFEGLLLSDDLSMQALGGTLGERARRAVAAGCDIALHCNGKMDEMKEVVAQTGPMTQAAWRRFEAGRKALARARAPLGAAGLADAEKQVASLVPAWG
jgi:beta-N-acetylhexosaminidase